MNVCPKLAALPRMALPQAGSDEGQTQEKEDPDPDSHRVRTGTHLLLPVLFQEGMGTCPLTGRSTFQQVASKMLSPSELPEGSDLG